jgi:Tol biopolymer transport system component
MKIRNLLLTLVSTVLLTAAPVLATIEQILYVCGSAPGDICAILPDGSHRTNLTNTPETNELDPDAAGLSRKIVYSAIPHGILTGWIMVMNADGSDPVRLTEQILQPLNPTWSPDGSKIAFSARIDGDFDIYIMNADGTGRVKLTENDSQDSGPQFSPDGQKIVFSSSRDGNTEVYVMNVDGSTQTRLTASDGFDQNAEYHPAGSSIIFASDRTGSFEVYTMGLDGSGQTALTAGGGPRLFQPSYSPGGHRIAFTIEEPVGTAEIFLMQPDGSGISQVTSEAETGHSPTWTIASDTDGDGEPDFADTDDDGDGVNDTVDNCRLTSNADQADFDLDGVGDACDIQTGPPTRKDQCKDNGWIRFDFPRAFTNQGDCLSFILSSSAS